MPGDYALNYTAVFLAAALGFGGILTFFLLSWLIAPRRATPLSGIAYECGIVPVGEGRMQLNLRYYLFALLFLIFGVEAAFLFPWAFVFLKMKLDPMVGSSAFYEGLFFLGILFLGLIYAWRKGVLQWR